MALSSDMAVGSPAASDQGADDDNDGCSLLEDMRCPLADRIGPRGESQDGLPILAKRYRR